MVDEETLAQIRKKLPAYIGTGKRYTHTLGVERETAALGTLFADAGLFDRFDIPRLRAAALLHDLTKQYTPEQQLQLCQRFSVQTDARLLASPKLLHARTGAVLARELFGKQIVDARVFRAIRYHTTARAHMDLWEKLLALLLQTILKTHALGRPVLHYGNAFGARKLNSSPHRNSPPI